MHAGRLGVMRWRKLSSRTSSTSDASTTWPGVHGTQLLLYDSKDLTTHAVCVGMTGSGKTGLCLALLEEAAIDGIPAIAIDPRATWATCC